MKKIKKFFSIILFVITIPILLVSLVILIDSWINPNDVPSFFGWKPFVTMSGSMETEIAVGDIVVIKEVDSDTLKTNDIIAFKLDDIVITHRIVDIKTTESNERYFITKGDNNQTTDKDYITEEQIEGIYKFKISKLGNFIIYIQNPTVLTSVLVGLIILLMVLETIDSKKVSKK